MKIILTIAIFLTPVLFSLQTVSAQQVEPGQMTIMNDEEAEALLKEVSQKFKSLKNMKADFSLTIEEPEGDYAEEKKGVVHLQGDMFTLNMDEYEITCDGKTSWMYSPATNEVQISYFELEDDMFTPSQIFDIYNEEYIYRVKSKKEGETVVELTPLDKDQSYFKIDMAINPVKKTINKCMIYEKSGMRYTYAISNLQTNIDLPDNHFSFDANKYPGIEVIDLR